MDATLNDAADAASGARLQRIDAVAERLGIPASALHHYGPYKAKLSLDYISGLADRPQGKLILVTAMSPTAAGEGKTTTTIGLADGMNRIGRQTAICIREPSLGPCFGAKGGATGGGRAQVGPMEDINLHFTGDFHAISTANNLLSALIDNHIYWGNAAGLDVRRITWRRVMDVSDRALRQMTISLGGVANGFPREDGFDITPASEVMAILCLSSDFEDLRRRLGGIVVGARRDRTLVRAGELDADGAMTALLRDALMPNIVQTLEGNPAFVHGGPFGNIAHGCNSIIATRTALRLADYVVTEAGFGSDLGAEKFFDIKCRKAGLKPDAAVIVASVRALKMHGGIAKGALGSEDVAAVDRGMANLARHVQNVRGFGVPVVVAVNRFPGDSDAEVQAVVRACTAMGVEAHGATHFAHGGEGTEALAQAVVRLADGGESRFEPLYPDEMPLWEKARTVAQRIYGAGEIVAEHGVRARLQQIEEAGFGHFPVCMAKTQYSFSTDPAKVGAPSGHEVPIREARLAAGAEFVVMICGDIMTMPGLPSVPAANRIGVSDAGAIFGLS